jgi:hypothetical protein
VVFQQGFPGGNDYGIYFAPQGGEPRIAVALPVDSTHTLQCPALVRDLDFGSVSMNARGGVAFRCGSLIWGTLQAGDSLKPIVSAAGMPSAPSWSPDGNALAFLALAVSSDESISQTRVVIMDFATRRARYIAAVPGHNAGWWTSANVYSVCWLSDGQLAFNAAGTDPDGAPPSASIYVVNVDGSGLTRVTTRATAFDHSVSCSQN